MLNNINTLDDLIKGVMIHGTDIIDLCQTTDSTELDLYKSIVLKEKLQYPFPLNSVNQENWFIPEEYKNIDIEEYLVNICPKENYDRLVKELEIYHKKNMIPVLKAIKYIVDTMENNNIVWGVGRGSSVASYVLFLLKVHRVDSVKYNLPIEEFFKGE